MVYYINPVNPKTWLDCLLTDENSEKLDIIHLEVVDLFKIPNADKLDENERAIVMDYITQIAIII